MEMSKNKLLLAGGAVAAAVVIVGVLLGTRHAFNPLETPMPAANVPIASIEPGIDKLKRADRQLLIGYLLLQRGELRSVPTQGLSFTAKTFGEAIAAQQALLVQKQVTAEWPLMRALEDQALRPLREAVSLKLVARRQDSMNNLFKSNTGATIVATGGTPDDARTVMVYQLRNNGAAAIAHLTGYIQPQVESADWLSILTHNTSACRVDIPNIAPGATVTVICAQIDLNNIGDASKTPDSSLFVDWRPDMVQYADGVTLAYDENAVTNTNLWNHYDIEGDIAAGKK